MVKIKQGRHKVITKYKHSIKKLRLCPQSHQLTKTSPNVNDVYRIHIMTGHFIAILSGL